MIASTASLVRMDTADDRVQCALCLATLRRASVSVRRAALLISQLAAHGEIFRDVNDAGQRSADTAKEQTPAGRTKGCRFPGCQQPSKRVPKG